MANPAFVQNYTVVRSAGPNTMTLSTPQTAGNLQVIAVGWYHNNSDTCTVTDSHDTWTKVPGTYQYQAGFGSSLGFSSQCFYKISTFTGTLTTTATAPSGGGQSYVVMGGAEFTNPYTGGGSIIDQVHIGASATNATPSSGNITTTFGRDILFGFVINDNTTATNSGSGWTLVPTVLFGAYVVEYQLPSATGTFAATQTGSAAPYEAFIVSFFGADHTTGHSISGSAGVASATVSWSGTASGSTTADGSGNYTIPALADGGYTVTPSKTGYTFAPTNSAQTVSGSDITGVNFTATPSAAKVVVVTLGF